MTNCSVRLAIKLGDLKQKFFVTSCNKLQVFVAEYFVIFYYLSAASAIITVWPAQPLV